MKRDRAKVGDVRIRKDGKSHRKWVKVNDFEWKIWARWAWEEKYGEVPEGKVVVRVSGTPFDVNDSIHNFRLSDRIPPPLDTPREGDTRIIRSRNHIFTDGAWEPLARYKWREHYGESPLAVYHMGDVLDDSIENLTTDATKANKNNRVWSQEQLEQAIADAHRMSYAKAAKQNGVPERVINKAVNGLIDVETRLPPPKSVQDRRVPESVRRLHRVATKLSREVRRAVPLCAGPDADVLEECFGRLAEILNQ